MYKFIANVTVSIVMVKKLNETDHRQYQLKNQNRIVDYFKCLGPVIRNNVTCIGEIKSRIGMVQEAVKEKFLTRKLDLNLWKKLVR